MDFIITSCAQAVLENPAWRALAIQKIPELAIPIARLLDAGHLKPNGHVTDETHILFKAMNAHIDRLREIRPEDDERLAETWNNAARARARVAQESRKAPTAMSMAKSITGAAAKEAAAIARGEPPTPAHTVAWRRLLCSGCPSLAEGSRPSTDRCKECGCFVYAKTLLRSQSCPIGKW